MLRSLGEVELGAREFAKAHANFDDAISRASNDRRLQAETWELKADAFESEGILQQQAPALLSTAAGYAEIKDHANAARMFAKAGSVQLALRHVRRARRSFKEAFDAYQICGNASGKRAMRDNLEALNVDVSALQSEEEAPGRRIPWFWIRLAFEIVVLGAASYLAFTR